MAGTFTDVNDYREYATEDYGGVTWFTENFRFMPLYMSGVSVYGYHGSEIDEAVLLPNYTTYGGLYTYEKALELCPAGCRLPSDEDWLKLEIANGMYYMMADLYGWRCTDGDSLLYRTTSGWYRDKNGTNTTGFSVLPGGLKDDKYFDNLTKVAYFWTSTQKQRYSSDVDVLNANVRMFSYESDCIYRGPMPTGTMLSVRYIVEYQPPIPEGD